MREMFTPPSGEAFAQGGNDTVELLKAWAGTSLAFAIFISQGFVFDLNFLVNLLIAAITCGLGFVVHELAHRMVARSYGAKAHFFSNDGMLVISILAAFATFFIAAPGAVWHRPLSTEKSGIIAIVGPISNFVLALLFLGFFFVAPTDFLMRTAWIGFNLNAWLGLFNMIPVDPFDGGKVWRWNKVAFGITAAVGIFMVFGLRGMVF